MPRPRDLSPEDSVGQLLWIGFEGTALTPKLERLLRRVRPGGVILFSRNIEDARQVRSLTDALYRSLPIPPFIAVDQEGGRVNRLRPILGPTPASFWLASLPGPAAAVKTHALATITALKSLGFNVNFAPVLDLSGPDPKNGIGDRAFGDDPRRVVDLASIALSVHLRAGVIPVGKHFPGLGSARADTHRTLPVIRRSRQLLWRRDLVPYRRLKRLLPIIMVGHAYYPALQGRRPHPATLARTVVEGLLRKRIGHRGLILTDDLEMGAIDQRLDGAKQARAALGAGSDGLMFCRSEARILEAREGLLRGLESGEITGARIEASLRRVLALKRRYLTTRRRGRLSRGSLARARLLLESLEGPAALGPDPTARP
jgi:beta-N-acetylhexosaminidase